MSGLFQVKLTSIYSSEVANPFYNMFGYLSVIPVVNEAHVLGDNFESGVIPNIAAVMSNAMEITALEVSELNGTGYDARSFPTGTHPGLRTGEAMPKFVVWGFRYNRSTLDGHSGAKRIGSISESDQNAGVATGSIVSALSTLADNLGASLFAGIVETWFPVILSAPEVVGDPWTSHGISSVSYRAVTTQNSRKR